MYGRYNLIYTISNDYKEIKDMKKIFQFIVVSAAAAAAVVAGAYVIKKLEDNNEEEVKLIELTDFDAVDETKKKTKPTVEEKEIVPAPVEEKIEIVEEVVEEIESFENSLEELYPNLGTKKINSIIQQIGLMTATISGNVLCLHHHMTFAGTETRGIFLSRISEDYVVVSDEDSLDVVLSREYNLEDVVIEDEILLLAETVLATGGVYKGWAVK